ncbi:hypothetical protein [Lacticaseibacillus sp. N501-2]|uniref:hypothetical protein n=1 Tax=Lacticaseibacillus salsurae TaxID=3367729 RepID=UPI0038B230D7
MAVKTDPLAFAAAVVNSSSPDLTVDEKLDLYIDAAEKAFAHNQAVVKQKHDDFYGNNN